jgi:hypothetical protein
VLGDEITIVKTTGANCIHWSVPSRLKQIHQAAVFVPAVSDAISSARKLEHPPEHRLSGPLHYAGVAWANTASAFRLPV